MKCSDMSVRWAVLTSGGLRGATDSRTLIKAHPAGSRAGTPAENRIS